PLAGPGTATLKTVAGAVAAACAALYWFPFALAIPATLCSPLFFRSDRRLEAGWWRMPLLGAAVSGLTIGCAVVAASVLAGSHSVADFLQWFRSSSHGWDQSRRLLR